jgi:hypothetical protein
VIEDSEVDVSFQADDVLLQDTDLSNLMVKTTEDGKKEKRKKKKEKKNVFLPSPRRNGSARTTG